MKNYRYFIEVKDENGTVIFSHKSDSAVKLVKMYNKEAYGEFGMFSGFRFGKMSTNIDERAWEMAKHGEEI